MGEQTQGVGVHLVRLRRGEIRHAAEQHGADTGAVGDVREAFRRHEEVDPRLCVGLHVPRGQMRQSAAHRGLSMVGDGGHRADQDHAPGHVGVAAGDLVGDGAAVRAGEHVDLPDAPLVEHVADRIGEEVDAVGLGQRVGRAPARGVDGEHVHAVEERRLEASPGLLALERPADEQRGRETGRERADRARLAVEALPPVRSYDCLARRRSGPGVRGRRSEDHRAIDHARPNDLRALQSHSDPQFLPLGPPPEPAGGRARPRPPAPTAGQSPVGSPPGRI
jgi:hypothetical protein